MSTNYDIDYNDKKFTEVENDKQQALTELEKTYGTMINDSDKYYQAQIDASKQWAETQSRLQQERTDYAIGQIEQQKDLTTKDYKKEQSGAYVDWQKESNRYGTNAEQMAAQGLANSGYSESSQVGMFNAYQNRVATARESYNLAIQNYNNSIQDARLQNSSILAEIAYQALQEQLELSLQGFQHKNQLLLEKANKKTSIENTYYDRYQDVLDQINHENALAEEVRQYNEKMASEKQKNATISIGKSNSSVAVSTYSEAAAYLRSVGATEGDGGLMTKNEWARRKASGSSAAEVQYGSYTEYLNNFVAWKKSNPD